MPPFLRRPTFTAFGSRLSQTKALVRDNFLSAHYNPQYVPFWPASAVLTDQYHPFFFRVLHRYQTAPREGLWWYVASNHLQNAKKCVRIRCGRRFKAAMVETLRERGWDSDGKALDGSVGLKGSLEMLALNDARDASWERLKKVCGKVVDAVSEAAKAPKSKPAQFHVGPQQERERGRRANMKALRHRSGG